MSDNDKNDTKAAAETELYLREGDIVWHTKVECICEVVALQPQLKPKPGIYVKRIAGCHWYTSDFAQDEVELLLPKDQVWYEVIVSDCAVKAFYKDKLILDIEFIPNEALDIAHYTMQGIRRNYICKQLLEMYPDSKISKAII